MRGRLTMNKNVLINMLSVEFNMTKTQAKAIMDRIIDAIADSLSQEQRVRLSGLGVFEVRVRKERTGRMPMTGEEITIPSRKVVGFRPSKTLKERINQK